MKKYIKGLIISIGMVAVICAAVILVGQYHYETGKTQGYLTGYSIGYADSLNGISHSATILAGEIVPYENGSGSWKGFMMGFPEGYSDAWEE